MEALGGRTLFVALLLGFLTALVGSAAAQEDDRDCSDFETQEEAQAFFEQEGGPEQDPHGLDQDNDGIACESLPSSGEGAGETESEPEGRVADDQDCADFATQEEAQALFEGAGPGDPHNLDADDDGIACESLPSAKAPDSTQAAPTTETEDDLPTTGFPIAGYGLLGLTVLEVGWGVLLVEDRLRRGPRPKDSCWEDRSSHV